MFTRVGSTSQPDQSFGWPQGGGAPVTAGGKLQLVQSPTFRSAPLTEGAFNIAGGKGPTAPPVGARPLGMSHNSLGASSSQGALGKSGGFSLTGGLGMSQRFGSAGKANKGRSRSLTSIEVNEVRALGGDAPVKGEVSEVPKNSHEALMQRLKSRAARQEAENNKAFLQEYKEESLGTNSKCEVRLDALLKGTAQRCEEMRQRSLELQTEVAEAERKLERLNISQPMRTNESDLAGMTAFERSTKKIQEDKREEDLQRQRDEVQANYAKVHRRLQSELIELRDYKVLLREFKRVRLEKLHEHMGRVEDGKQLRACVREMVRNGAQRILQKLEDKKNMPLDSWMCEVLVNSCHIEIRIEEAEQRLLEARRKALHPVKADVQDLLAQTKQERFEQLCNRTWDSRESQSGSRAMNAARRQSDTDGQDVGAGSGEEGAAPSAPVTFAPARQRAVPAEFVAEMTAREQDIAALRRLLNDMRQNAAAVICNQIRQAEKNLGREARSWNQAKEWGRHMLTLLVSEEFAKQIMKELQKSGPQSGLTR